MSGFDSLVSQAVQATAGQLFDTKTPPGQAAYQSTRVIASFHTDDGFDGAVDSTSGLISGQPFRIVGLTTTKSFGSEPGSWSLVVKPRGTLDVMNLWADPEDVWVRIVIVRNGTPIEVFLGLLNTITEDVQRGGKGERTATYILQGHDFHKVFVRTMLYINIHESAGELPIIPMYSALKDSIIGRPDEIVKSLIDAWLGNNGVADKQWALPKSLGGGYFFDLLELDFQETRGQINDPSLYSPDQFMGRPLWASLETYANGLLNEMFTTQAEDAPFDAGRLPRPRLTLRERPFPSRDKGERSWEGLPTHVLVAGDVKSRKVTKGAPESRFNYWLLNAAGLLGDGYDTQLLIQQLAQRDKGVPGSAPIYNIEDIRRHGFRRFMQTTRAFPFRDDINWFLHSARWLQLVHDWYIVTPFELAGTIGTAKIFPEIRIGHRVVEKRKDGNDVTYYVEAVTHNWEFPGAGTSQIHVTRGEYHSQHLLDIAYERIVGGEHSALNSREAAAVGLVFDSEMRDAVPTGSGPRLDKAIGQIDTPERLFLKRRGKIQDQRAIEKGEPQTSNPDRIRTLKPADLPDQQVPISDEIAVGRATDRPRKPGGNLTQRELETGQKLPVKEQELAEPESSKDSASDMRERWRKTSRANRGRKR